MLSSAPRDSAAGAIRTPRESMSFWDCEIDRQFGLPVTSPLFNTVGPRQVGMYGMVLPRFALAALANQPLEVYGDGSQTCCFCHVLDVVDALVALMATPKSIGEVFNLGSDQEISIGDLALCVIAATGSSSSIRHIPYAASVRPEFRRSAATSSKARKLRGVIDFKVRHTLDQIIADVAGFLHDKSAIGAITRARIRNRMLMGRK